MARAHGRLHGRVCVCGLIMCGVWRVAAVGAVVICDVLVFVQEK